MKILDMGFFETFDRPFDPVADGSYTDAVTFLIAARTAGTTAPPSRIRPVVPASLSHSPRESPAP